MHFALSFILLVFVVLQQTIHVESLISPIQSADNGAARPNAARRLRAPLMGRSLLSVSPSDNGMGFINHESGSSSVSDDDELVLLNKRRYGVPLFGRRWAPNTRRGPLFG